MPPSDPAAPYGAEAFSPEAPPADVARWLAAQPDADALARTWRTAGLAVPPLPEPDRAARARLLARITETQPARDARSGRAPDRPAAGRTRRRLGVLAATAALAVVVASGIGLWRAQTVTARARGAVLAVALPDGSDVTLSPGSEVRYRRAFGARDVVLSGEAFFSVAHDPARPFSVETPEARVVVLGTRFAVRAWGAEPEGAARGETAVVVEQGRVRVAARGAAGRTVVLTAGRRAVVAAGGTLRDDAADVSAATAWRDAAFAVYDAPLGAVAVQVERAYRTPVRLAPGVDVQERVTALLPRADRAEDVLADLAATLGYRVVVRDTDITLTP